MDKDSLRLIKRVWRHSGIEGSVWVPHIYKIGHKTDQRFREGSPIDASNPNLPEMRDEVDWYWTPAVSSSDSRKAGEYPAQRVLWVDCDESYNNELLMKLMPSYVWETSPGHKQAVWLLKDSVGPEEYHRDGLMGLLTQALGGDKSGVDIGQLLRVPGTWHHKGKPFKGSILKKNNVVQSQGQLLTRVAKALGFPAGLASELGADDPYGDRSKQMWKFSRTACELGVPQDLTFKLLNACKWNKWKGHPDSLRADIESAYSAQPGTVTEDIPAVSPSGDLETVPPTAWDMATVGEFGPVIHKPLRWVVPGIIPEAGCGLLVSSPKVGKTRVAIEIALGVSAGDNPLGVSVQRSQGVGFFSLEDGEYLFSSRMDSSLNRDQGRFRYHWDGHISRNGSLLRWEPPHHIPLFTSFHPVDLSHPEDKQRLLETILKYELKLVIVDTLSMAIGKSDVSNAKDMYSILKDLKVIAKETNCAIMFLHHTRKRVFEKGESIQEMVLGSTALHAWSDFVLSLASPEEDLPTFLRLGVQTKMGTSQHYVSPELKILVNKESEESSD